MKKISCIALVLLLATTPAMAQEMKPLRTITVTGQAQRKVVPDEAHVNVNLNAQEKSVGEAKSAHDAKLKKLMKIVDDAGIDEKKVATQSSSVQPVYSYVNDAKGNNQRHLDGYRVQTSLDITVADTSKLGKLIDTITAADFERGANTEWGNLLNVYYGISNPDKLRDEMLVEAIDNAKAKATRMAAAAGTEITRPYQITEGGSPQFTPRPMPMMAKAAMASMDAAIAPPAGEQQVESSVTVTYELKE